MTKLNMAEVAKRLDSGTVAISIADATQTDMPLVYVNAAFTAMTGFAANRVIGQNCRFLQRDLDNEAPRARMRDALARGAPAQVVFRNRRADGTEFDNLVVIEPLTDRSGNLIYIVGSQFVLQDDTRPAKARSAGHQIVQEIDKLLELNERLRATSRQALARSMAATVKLWLER